MNKHIKRILLGLLGICFIAFLVTVISLIPSEVIMWTSIIAKTGAIVYLIGMYIEMI